VTGSTRSLWLQEAMAAGFEPAPLLEGNERADVCIVGGGYTGLWTALHLKELDPLTDVAVVEADICGGGASGRNGGFVLSWWAKFESLVKLCGIDEAIRLGRASADAVAAIGQFCGANGLDAHLRPDGWIWAAVNPAQMGSWRPVMEALERAGVTPHPFRELSAEETAARTGSPIHIGGVFEASAATVQPALLAFGLRRMAMERGVRIHEGSPMIELRSGRPGGPVVVRTPDGAVAASRAVLAMNAWSVRFREIRRRILVVGSDIVATEPIPDRLREFGWSNGVGVSDSRLLVHYYRTTADGRVTFGKGGGRLAFGRRVGRGFDGASARRAAVAEALRFTYPSLSGVEAPLSWTGPIDRSRTGLPIFGKLAGNPNVLFGVGYSGNGVGPSWLGGRILASLALGREDEWSGCPLVDRPSGRGRQRFGGFPPEPFRFVGGHMVRRAIERSERAEDRGGTPSRFDRLLVRLAPAGLVPAGRSPAAR
jgi:putative aminophosphonate oxidoreductase